MNDAAAIRPDASAPSQVDLALEGMTCAACATRIEKVLNRLPATQAAVNFATESAQVRFDPAATPVDALIAAVERAGYRAHVKADAEQERASEQARRADALGKLRDFTLRVTKQVVRRIQQGRHDAVEFSCH